MRLLHHDNQNVIRLTKDLHDSQRPDFAILSHCWAQNNDEEVLLAEIDTEAGRKKPGYKKIQFCAEQARKDGLEYFWVDTCCIDKTNNVELQEAINSMFRWYREAQKCYVYLPDVSAQDPDPQNVSNHDWKPSFRKSRWFTRGWTLQELLAPKTVEFFSVEKRLLGTKQTLAMLISTVTRIPTSALQCTPLSQFPIDEKIRWTENRETTKKEDKAYCLLGIFDVFIPLIYGEGENAIRRLKKKIRNQHGQDASSLWGASNETRPLGLCFGSAPTIDSKEFVGRTAEIDRIHEILRPHDTDKEQRRVVLGGMGGLGKTQLAIAYARRYQQDYTSVLWLSAKSESTLFASLLPLARVIGAKEFETTDNQQLLSHVLTWLSRPRNTRWLLIFDNYDDPDLYSIDKFCPVVGYGSIIITTRLPDLVKKGKIVRLEPLRDITDSISILKQRSCREGMENGQTTNLSPDGTNDLLADTGAKRLATRLDGFPLALVTAGAFLRKSTMTFDQYLDAYERDWKVSPRRPAHILDYDQTLYTTWNMTYDRLRNEDGDAALMLKLLAYFDNQNISYDLLHKGLSPESPEWMHRVLEDGTTFENVMAVLVDYGLVDIQHSNQSYSMHTCLHDWTFGELNADIEPQFYWHGFDCVFNSIEGVDPYDLGNMEYKLICQHALRLTHSRAMECAALTRGLPQRARQAGHIGRMLYQQIQYQAAEQIYRRVVATYDGNVGSVCPSALEILRSLGNLLIEMDQFDEAEQVLTRALNEYNTKFPGMSPEVKLHMLDVVQTLGKLYHWLGRLGEAEQMYDRARIGRETLLGSDHPDTLRVVSRLGLLYCDQGNLDKAEQQLTRASVGLERARGPDHIMTLDVVEDLAALYSRQGKQDKAEQLSKRLLSSRQTTQGPDHVDTHRALNILANVYIGQGKFDQAEDIHRQLLDRSTIIWGAMHTTTFTIFHNLGELYLRQNRVDDAEEMLSRAWQGRRTALGSGHIYTLSTLHNLGIAYHRQGRLHEAEQAYLESLAGSEKVLGSEHPEVLKYAVNFYIFYRDQGRIEEAEELESRYGFDTVE